MGIQRDAGLDSGREPADHDPASLRLSDEHRVPSQLSIDDQLTPGSVWFVSSYLLSGGDVKDERPVVIVQGPRSGITIVIVWARTTDTTMKGVLTPAGVLTGLNKEGVFAPRHQHSMDNSRLREPVCRYVGHLPEPYLSAVLNEWESR